MRLSDAIGLGRTLVKLNPSFFLNASGTCGCAIGMGLRAVGHDMGAIGAIERISKEWPWVDDVEPGRFTTHRARIGIMAEEVQRSLITLDQLIDYVRSVEPAEVEAKEIETIQQSTLAEQR